AIAHVEVVGLHVSMVQAKRRELSKRLGDTCEGLDNFGDGLAAETVAERLRNCHDIPGRGGLDVLWEGVVEKREDRQVGVSEFWVCGAAVAEGGVALGVGVSVAEPLDCCNFPARPVLSPPDLAVAALAQPGEQPPCAELFSLT